MAATRPDGPLRRCPSRMDRLPQGDGCQAWSLMYSLRRKRTRRATRALQALPVRESGTATPPFAFSPAVVGLTAQPTAGDAVAPRSPAGNFHPHRPPPGHACDDGDPWKLVRRGCGIAGFGHLTVWVRGKPRGVSADYCRRLVSLWSHQIDSQAPAKRGHRALGITRNLLTHNVTSTHNLIGPRTQKSPPKRGQPQPETPTPVNGL